MISLENTEIAFKAQNDKELHQVYWLFRLIGNPRLVKVGEIFTHLALRIHLPIGWLIKPTVFRHFCGGETIPECYKKVQELATYNIGSILDYSSEGKEREEDFNRCMENISATIERARNDKNIPFSVFKVTGIARFALLEKLSEKKPLTENEKNEFERVEKRVNKLCEKAREVDVPILIDAEESWIQEAIDQLANNMMKKWNKEKVIVYNTFQLYRTDRLRYLEQSLQTADKENFFLGAKLVRGAYMEQERERASAKGYASPIHSTKEACDKAYDDALTFCIQHINRIALCAGTHNEKSSLHLVQLINEKNISTSNKHVYFSQLLGMSDHISYNLSSAGYNVAKYVPFGPIKEVLPYLIRRAQENTSVKGQVGRELGLILKEKKRRLFVKG